MVTQPGKSFPRKVIDGVGGGVPVESNWRDEPVAICTLQQVAFMKAPFTRRHFLQSSLAASVVAATPTWLHAAASAPTGNDAFSFVLLGDLHYDKLEHHDMAWVRKDKPHDVSQIENYSRITRDISPLLLATVRQTIADRQASGRPRVAFVLQAGDLVEGLCGNEELSIRQNSESVAFIRDAKLGVPLLFTKGNHDITGPGAVAAFSQVFHPFLTEQARAVAPSSEEVKSARYTVNCGRAQFVFFDAYQASESLAWFEAVAAKRTADHFFVVVHPPVVPYGARSTWHVLSSEKDRPRREKLLTLLGDQQALVLGGHIHRYSSLVRKAGRGRFTQFALSSVISSRDVQARDLLTGAEAYNGDQVRVEPKYSPETEPARRAVYETERPFVPAFEYADLPGYAVVTVDGANVTAEMYAGVSRQLWRTATLSLPRAG